MLRSLPPASFLSRFWGETAHDNNLAPGVGPALDQTGPNTPTFSGLGQFRPYILTLRKQAERAFLQQRISHCEQRRQWSKRPRGDDIERFSGVFHKLLDTHRVHRRGGADWLALLRGEMQLFCRCFRRGAREHRGYLQARRRWPGPEIHRRLRSQPIFGLPAQAGGAATNWPHGGSKLWLRSSARSNSSAAASRGAWQQSGRGGRLFHVKQGSVPARVRGRAKGLLWMFGPGCGARLAVRPGPRGSCRAAAGFSALPAQMSHQQRQRRRGNAIDAAGMADGARSVGLQLVPHLVRQAG